MMQLGSFKKNCPWKCVWRMLSSHLLHFSLFYWLVSCNLDLKLRLAEKLKRYTIHDLIIPLSPLELRLYICKDHLFDTMKPLDPLMWCRKEWFKECFNHVIINGKLSTFTGTYNVGAHTENKHNTYTCVNTKCYVCISRHIVLAHFSASR